MGLRVQLLGRFSVWRDDALVKRWDADQTKTLLKILLTERGQIFLCDQLIEYLWPDYEDYDQALHFLRVRIHSLRRTIEPGSQPRANYILTYPNGYAFNAEADCTIDTEELNNVFEQAQELVKRKEYETAMLNYEKAVSLYLGEYLPENRYDEWANIERNKYSQVYVNALLGFAECLARQGEYRRAGDLCRKALTVNKYNEDIYRQSMIYNYLMGNHAEAIRLYQECEQILAEGLEVRPSTSIRLLYESIVNGNVSEIDSSYPIPKPVRHPIHHSLGRLPFVGREQECGRLFASLEEASKGKGRMILIGGEAGVGKTRLIREVIQHAREQFKTVALIGQCTVLGSKQPYQSLLVALQAYLVTLSGKTFEDVPPLSLSVLSPWIPGLPELAKASAPLALLSADQERLRFFEGVSQLVICLARVHGPLIFFLDDLQWSNPSTIDFLDYLSLKISDCPILIFGAYRSDEVIKGHSLANLLQRAIREGAEGHIYSLQLPNLAEKTIDELLHYTAPKMKDRHRLSRYLKQKSGGNPFFLVSILQSLFETKVLRVTPEGHWIADAATITRSQIKVLPREVKEVVEVRLERLANEDRHLLEIMSVIGHESRRALLQRLCRDLITNCDEIELMRHLENLEQAQLISAENQSYSFVHDILREVTYQRTSSADRLLLHRHLAEIFEEFYQTDPQPPHGLLAYHYARAGTPQKALEHLLPALREAVAGYRNEEGLELAAEAWGFTEQLAEQNRKDRAIHQLQFEILSEKIKIYDILGKRQEQEAALADLSNIANTVGDEKKLAQAHLMQAKLYLDTVRYSLAQVECMKAMKIAKTQKDLAMQANSVHCIAIAHYRMSNYDQALAYLEQEHKLRNALGDDRNLAETFHYLAVVSWRRGDYEDTTKYYREALKMLNHINYRQDRARILTAMGTMYWSQGDFQQAIKTYEEVQRLAVDIGDRRAEAEALSNLASTWFTLGEYERALKLRQQASDIHYTIGEKRMYSWDLNFMGSLYWSLGQDDLAHQYFEKTQKIATDIGWPEGQAFTLNNIGLLHWRAKEFDKALKLSQKALEIHQNIGTKHELEIVLRNLGEIYCDAGKYSKSLEYLDKALLISQTLGSKIEEMQILSDQSATYLKMGKMKKAVTCSRQSLKLLKQTRRSPHAPKLLFSHFQALHAAAQKDEALKSLYRAYRALMRRAKRINNPEFRQSFLENVPVNREIIEFYRRYFQPLELSEAESYLLLHRIRWPKGVISPCCGSKQVHVHGQVNRTSEKRYLCMKCRKTFTDRIGTAFANKNLPLSKLLQALVVVSRATDESIATQAITKLGIHAYTAKNLYRKWSAALREDKLLQRLSSELNKKSL